MLRSCGLELAKTGLFDIEWTFRLQLSTQSALSDSHPQSTGRAMVHSMHTLVPTSCFHPGHPEMSILALLGHLEHNLDLIYFLLKRLHDYGHMTRGVVQRSALGLTPDGL